MVVPADTNRSADHRCALSISHTGNEARKKIKNDERSTKELCKDEGIHGRLRFFLWCRFVVEEIGGEGRKRAKLGAGEDITSPVPKIG